MANHKMPVVNLLIGASGNRQLCSSFVAEFTFIAWTWFLSCVIHFWFIVALTRQRGNSTSVLGCAWGQL